jgi:predicted SnoaL-like aldol condensation-catalyzing enzyme
VLCKRTVECDSVCVWVSGWEGNENVKVVAASCFTEMTIVLRKVGVTGYTIVCMLFITAFITAPALAAPPPAASLEANKKLVLDYFRVVFEAQNAEAARDYLSENCIQHNPKLPAGRDGFIRYYRGKWKESKPVKAELSDKPVKIVAEGDLVSVMWKYQKEDSLEKGKKYDAFWFDMFRIQDGKIVEHWDNALR